VLAGGVAVPNRLPLNETVLVCIVAAGTLVKTSPQWNDKIGPFSALYEEGQPLIGRPRTCGAQI
jgi:hypothetical protein